MADVALGATLLEMMLVLGCIADVVLRLTLLDIAELVLG